MIASFIVVALLSIAAIVGTVGIIGLFRFPDAYSRLHAGSLASTTAVFTVFLATPFIDPSAEFISRMIIIILFFLISSPTSTHFVVHLLAESGYLAHASHAQPDDGGNHLNGD